jgi:sugar/nucleoside kinase (ribokinase family)
VPPWNWAGLKPLLNNLDALYINLISGFELELETLQLIRGHFRGPIYLDLHSLLLGIQADGTRVPRPIADPRAWFACADLLQVNEQEMSLMAPDPMALAATATHAGVQSLIVTLGKRGVVYFLAPGFDKLADLTRGEAGRVGAIRTALVPAQQVATPGDPTGCGDVFGATYFSRLLTGDTFAVALKAAIHAASRNVVFRGAGGLAAFLRGELLRT